MARIRQIKPALYKHEGFAACSMAARFMFPGLWGLADSQGRLEDRPKRIHAELFPYEPDVDVDALLDELARIPEGDHHPFVLRYEVDGRRYIQIVNFRKHQRLSGREASEKSEYPAPQRSGWEASGKTENPAPSRSESSRKQRGSDAEAMRTSGSLEGRIHGGTDSWSAEEGGAGGTAADAAATATHLRDGRSGEPAHEGTVSSDYQRPATDTDTPDAPENRPTKAQQARTTGANGTTLPEPPAFAQFWNEYPRHAGRAKALEVWRRLAPDEELEAAIMAGLRRAMKNPQWARDGGQFIPHASTWLTGRRWEDEETRAVTLGLSLGDRKQVHFQTLQELGLT